MSKRIKQMMGISFKSLIFDITFKFVLNKYYVQITC